ncbi:prepilin-type N-terminal cleavage/methylation domain-containing protein [Motilimonas cestriensis]|uniref:prepilin-type N-terminal cleavage/methylation domain-containing protein n=1 Tax=Motilimonas cestriensis TaxID=2742685 RepID=UPI003DA478CB
MYLKKQHGFSLVELMISLVLGTLVIAMISSLYVSGVVNNINSIKYSRMKTDLQAVMHLMESDIRRAGFRGDTISYAMGTVSGANNFMWEEDATITIGGVVSAASAGVATKIFAHNSVPDSCIVFMYDFNKTGGIPEAEERFGYRLKDNAVQLGHSIDANPADCTSSGTWEKITDPNLITIKSLKFTPRTIDSDRTRMRLIKIDLTGEVSIAQKTATETMSSEIQIRNLELYRQ